MPCPRPCSKSVAEQGWELREWEHSGTRATLTTDDCGVCLGT